jgi:hypothetical protein
MREHARRLRRTQSLFVYWRDDRLIFHNFASRLAVSARPVTCEVLDFFSDWRTKEEAIHHFSAYSRRSVLSSLSQLLKQGLLLPKGSREAARDALIAKHWSEWLPEGSFHFATKDAAMSLIARAPLA